MRKSSRKESNEERNICILIFSTGLNYQKEVLPNRERQGKAAGG